MEKTESETRNLVGGKLKLELRAGETDALRGKLKLGLRAGETPALLPPEGGTPNGAWFRRVAARGY